MIVAVLLRLIELPTFEVLSEQFWYHRHLKSLEIGRGNIHLSLESDIAQFECL